jgi:hypothetical protein
MDHRSSAEVEKTLPMGGSAKKTASQRTRAVIEQVQDLDEGV